MNAVISETMKATILGLGMQIPEIPAQRNLVSPGYPLQHPQTAHKCGFYSCSDEIITLYIM